ncbi:TIGR04104 family putative zinc finger protein [Oceanobacillus sp. CAU 1775]
MPVCQNCGKTWTWKQTMKTMFRMRCPNCRAKQYQSAASRNKSFLFVLILILMIPIKVWFDLPLIVGISITAFLVMIILIVYPFFLKLSNEEEPYA